MNNCQKGFLDELSALCSRYGVEIVDVEDDHVRIVSNGEELLFKEYNNIDMTFFGIVSAKERYEVTPNIYIRKVD